MLPRPGSAFCNQQLLVGDTVDGCCTPHQIINPASLPSVGVVILHLLLVPGVSFLAGGARVLEQELHSHHTQLNHSLLTIGLVSY